MTDSPTPVPDDEVVSATLDGEADAEEAARVLSDPALTARLEEFRAVSAWIAADMPAAPPGAVDTAVAAALATNTIDLEAKRAARVNRARRLLPVAAAAAAVLVLVGTVALIKRDSNDKGTAVAAVDDKAQANATTLAAPTAAAGSGSQEDYQSGAASTAFRALGPVGTFDTATEFAQAVWNQFQASPPAPAADTNVTNDSSSAAARQQTDPELQTLLSTADGSVDGTAAIALVFATTTGESRVVVVDASCALITSVDF